MSAYQYHVQSSAGDVRDGFPSCAHHDSISALWSRKWRGPCAAGLYPFVDGDVRDFDPIFAMLVRDNDDDPANPQPARRLRRSVHFGRRAARHRGGGGPGPGRSRSRATCSCAPRPCSASRA